LFEHIEVSYYSEEYDSNTDLSLFYVYMMTELIAENPHLTVFRMDYNLQKMHKEKEIHLSKLISEYFMYVLLMAYKVLSFGMQINGGKYIYPADLNSKFVVKCALWPVDCMANKEPVYIKFFNYLNDPVKWCQSMGIANVRKYEAKKETKLIIVIEDKTYIFPLNKFNYILSLIDDIRSGKIISERKKYQRYSKEAVTGKKNVYKNW